MNEPVSKFWLVCEDNVCHCDWRISIVDCEEEYYAKAFYTVVGVTSGVLALMGTRTSTIIETFFLLRSLLSSTIRQTNTNMYYFLLVLLRTYIRYEK
jgi:hypothetical protein